MYNKYLLPLVLILSTFFPSSLLKSGAVSKAQTVDDELRTRCRAQTSCGDCIREDSRCAWCADTVSGSVESVTSRVKESRGCVCVCASVAQELSSEHQYRNWRGAFICMLHLTQVDFDATLISV